MMTTGIFLDAFKKSKINPIPKTEKSSCSFGELLRKYVCSFRSRLGAWLNCIIDNIYGSNIPLHSDIWAWWHSKSARPEIRGSNVFLWRSLSPSQNVPFNEGPSYAVTTLIIFRCGRTGRDRWLQL